MTFLEEVDRWLSEHEIDPSQGGKTTRLGIGVYLIRDD